MEDLKEYIKNNKNKPSGVEIRLLDTKNGKVAYKELTIGELALTLAGMEIKFKSLNKEEKKCL
jgi:hypothetical protein